MNKPGRRLESRFIHIDSRDFSSSKSKFNVEFGKHIPIQDYNNVIRLELKVLCMDKPVDEDYAIFKIKNIDGKVDATNQMGDITTVVYFEGSRQPVFFGGNKFEFQPALSKLTKLDIEILKRNSDSTFELLDVTNTNYISFLLKISYIEGNLY